MEGCQVLFGKGFRSIAKEKKCGFLAKVAYTKDGYYTTDGYRDLKAEWVRQIKERDRAKAAKKASL